MALTCFFCEQPVERNDTQTWHQMIVWVGGPKRHGSRLAEETGNLAHADCIQKAVAGISPDMEPMF